MLLLPTFDALLSPCAVSPAAFAAHEKGRFCGSCQRVVQDFSQSTNPMADLAAARAASVDGRVCGSFRTGQVAQQPSLTRRLRWFLVALVLVVGQGLTAREALAQVRREASGDSNRGPALEKVHSKHLQAHPSPQQPDRIYGAVVEQMPTFRGGGLRELSAYIQKQLHWPEGAGATCVEGRLFISFTVDKAGLVRDVTLRKGLHPLFDAEALRVIKALTGFKPGRQNGEPVATGMTVPVTFKLE